MTGHLLPILHKNMRIKKPTKEDIKQYKREELKSQIREIYSVDEEFRILNLGIKNPKSKEYLKYRKTIDDMVKVYKKEVKDG